MSAKRILLIDDEQALSSVVATCLRKLGGWQVAIANSGSEGLLLAETEQPDAILLDVMMPDMDGYAVLEKLENNPATRSIPVILLTAKVQTSNHGRYSHLRVAGAIAKPFDPLKLTQQIAVLLGWKS
jgi:CheY-like chemotaxis protein